MDSSGQGFLLGILQFSVLGSRFSEFEFSR